MTHFLILVALIFKRIKGSRKIFLESVSRLNCLKFCTEVVFVMPIKSLNGHKAVKGVLLKLYHSLRLYKSTMSFNGLILRLLTHCAPLFNIFMRIDTKVTLILEHGDNHLCTK